jgi:hypothetical protein
MASETVFGNEILLYYKYIKYSFWTNLGSISNIFIQRMGLFASNFS